MNEKELWRGRPSLWNTKISVFRLIKTLVWSGVFLYCSRYIPDNPITVPNIPLPDFLSKMEGDQFYMVAFFSLLIFRRVVKLVRHFINILCIEIRLTEERLNFREGILNKFQKGIDLYRIKDLSLYEPFLFRLLRLQNIHIVTSDSTIRFPRLIGMPKKDDLYNLLNQCAEKAREKKGVKEVDYYGR